MNGNKFWSWVANCLPNFGEHTITGPNGSPYLRRIYLTPRRKNASGKAWWPGVFLHHFYRSDSDRLAPHNHPWQNATSLILAGGYTEHRYYPEFDHPAITDPVPEDFRWTHKTHKPGSINRIKANDFHWVELLDETNGAWSLFFAFDNVQDWGFFDTIKNKFLPWREYLGITADGLEKD